MPIQIYGIPNCGTCQKALKWLDANGVAYQFINLKEHPPGREMVEGWVESLTAKAMGNTSGRSYRELGEEKKTGLMSNGLMPLLKMLCCSNDPCSSKMERQF